jgi:TATA-box binding protein (TBP) (component of TFIID and TFIIIB)
MYSSIANNMFSYLMTMNEIRSSYPDEHKPSFIKLTTITMVAYIGQEIEIEKIRDYFAKNKKLVLRKKGSNAKGFEWRVKMTEFYNQITLTYQDCYSNKSIKLFPNGSVQVAGCCDVFDCKRIIVQLSALFKIILDIDEIDKDNFRIVLINTNFSLNYKLNQYKICEEFSKHPDIFKVTYDPDRYSAVLIKFKPAENMKQITVSIFGTGKIILTGAETLKEIVFGYQIINQVLYNNREKLKVEKSDETDVFNIFLGYKIPEMVSFLKKKKIASWAYTRRNLKINF